MFLVCMFWTGDLMDADEWFEDRETRREESGFTLRQSLAVTQSGVSRYVPYLTTAGF